MTRQPAIFVSHGAPTLPFEDHGAVPFLNGLMSRWSRPKAILVVSAHWETAVPTVSTTDKPETIHDFYGFPKRLYDIRYPSPGAPEIADRARSLLRDRFPVVASDAERGLDHGAWIPLLLMVPQADIPTFQVSIQWACGPTGAADLGRALAPLRDEGVMILASGGATHNLSQWRGTDGMVPPAARKFDDWLRDRIAADDRESLLDYRERAPHAEAAHPRDEHLLPLFAAMGAGGRGHTLYRGFSHGVLSMAAYAFD